MQKFDEMCVTTHWDNFHHAKIANHGTSGIQLGCTDGHPTGTYWVFNPKTKKKILIKDTTGLQKSYNHYNKVEKSVLVAKSYERLNDEEELKMVPVVNQNNDNYNVVSNSESDT